jgi:hypothetical protein
MTPRRGCALAHPQPPPLHPLEGVRLQVAEEQEPPIRRCGPRPVRVGRRPPGGTRPSIEAPGGHRRLERRVKRRHQLPTLLYRQTGQVEPLGGAGLEVGKPSRAHSGGLRSSEAHGPTKRD